MKGRFSTIDIAVVVQELKRFLGMRVVNVYDIDNKTYLIKVGKPDEKTFILLESGIRLHSTEFDWPKNPAPSNFSMKLRKHVKGRRFERITQLGVDRIVDLQFGSNEAAYHVILELYDRGNIILTDFEYTILNILRPRTDNSQDVRFAVREIYPIETFKTHTRPTEERLQELFQGGKDGDVLKKILVPNLDYGPAVIDHALASVGFPEHVKLGVGFNLSTDMPKMMLAIEEAERLLAKFMADPCQGYILQKKDKKSSVKDGETEEIILYEEFHPFLFKQHENKSYSEFVSYDKALDEFFSKLESQKLDMKVIQHEKSAMKKLDNVKKDHEKRIHGLQKEQETDILKGQLIEMNLDLVDQAILIVRSALANQIDWTEIWALVKEAQMNNDPVAAIIKGLKLDTNHITVLLGDPFPASDEDDVSETHRIKPMKVDLDLSLSAYGNSRKCFEKKKQAAKKEQKTAEASNKAFKSAEKKTKQSLKEVQTAVSINKTRKTYWFEKFLWFITSENYVVIGGRDQQQNEMIVKRYMKPGDLYVHADLHGASSCVVKNPGGGPVPPKTLNEAGTMAICNSAAWDSKVVTSAWWVYQDQVSKTAPSGEYLTTGSFMIRGKKNYLPPSYLIYGFGFLFKLEEGSVERHAGERKVKGLDDDEESVIESATASLMLEDHVELDVSDGSSDNDGDEEATDKGDKCEEVNSAEGGVDELKKSDLPQVPESEVPVKEEAKEDAEDVTKSGKSVTGTKKVVNASKAKAEDFAFPDTNIRLQHMKGDKYELNREVSHSDDSFEPIFLGDSQPVVFGEKAAGKNRLSAKQRRDLKKGKITTHQGGSNDDDEEEDKASWLHPIQDEDDGGKDEADDDDADEDEEDEVDDSASTLSKTSKKSEKCSVPQAPPPKRGQKSKRRRMKEKYADQDEEERILKMELLASAGSHKKSKKKEKEEVQTKQQKGQQGSKGGLGKGQGKVQPPPHWNRGESGDAGQVVKAEGEEKPKQPNTGKEGPESDGEKEENAVADDLAVLNSLTGVPVSEDELLFAIPVCAPYNALLNYKFKVKLLPGSSKKGKAVKTAVNMFLHEKTTSSREKDLLKIQKDVDLSRNVPGKVKVAAPNLHRNKR